MSYKNLIATWIDVINNVPQFFNWDSGRLLGTTKSQIYKFLQEADGYVKSYLQPIYGKDLTLSDPYFQEFSLHSNKSPDLILDRNKISVFGKETVIYRFQFGEVSPPEGEENPPTYNLTIREEDLLGTLLVTPFDDSFSVSDADSNIVIVNTSAFEGYDFMKGDVVYLVKYIYEPLLVSLVSKLTANFLINRIYASQSTELSGLAIDFKKEVDMTLKRLIDTELGSQLLCTSQKTRSITPEPVYYDINRLGHDVTEYSDSSHYPAPDRDPRFPFL